MHLKTLKLENFRSFRKRTVEFRPGMTAIVGQNGAGKSNLLLAIDFVLSSRRPLHSKRDMEVYVYSKMSKGRERVLATFAKVELIFDAPGCNIRGSKTDGTLKISRRIEFNGLMDELRVNGRKVSRVEMNTIIQMLGFNSTNPCNYIRATRLDELLDSNGLKRKEDIEQIAGVSTYNSQKTVDAHKLLNNLKENLFKVDEKIDEFDKGIEPIMSKFENIIDNMKFKDEYLKCEVALLFRKQSDCLGRSSEFVKSKELIERTLREIESDLSVVRETRAKVLQSIEELENSSERERQDFDQVTERIADLELALAEHRTQYRLLQTTIVNDESLKMELQEKCKEVDHDLAEKEAEFETLAEKERATRITIGELDAAKDLMDSNERYVQTTTTMENELIGLQRVSEEQDKQMEQYGAQLAKIDEDKKVAVGNLMSALFTAKRSEFACDEQRKVVERVKQFREGFVKTVEEKKTLLQKAKNDLFACASMNVRLGLLSFEKLLYKFRAEPEAFGSIIAGYHGRLIDLITVGAEYSLAVQMAAGDLLYAHIVDSHTTARAIIAAFRESSMPGTLNFLTLEQCTAPEQIPVLPKVKISQSSVLARSQQSSAKTGNACPPSEGSEDESVQGSSDEEHERSSFYDSAFMEESYQSLLELITFDKRFAKPVAEVFEKWTLIEDLEKGRRLTTAVDHLKCITPDGRVILSRGILSGGAPKDAEVFRLNSALKQCSEDVDDEDLELSSLGEELNIVEGKLAELEEESVRDCHLVSNLKGSIENFDLKLEQVGRSLDALKEERSCTIERIAEVTQTLEERKKCLEKARSMNRRMKPATLAIRMKTAKQTYADLKNEIAGIKCSLEHLKAKKHELELELTNVALTCSDQRFIEIEQKCEQIERNITEERMNLEFLASSTNAIQRLNELRLNADKLANAVIEGEANLIHTQHIRSENKAVGRCIIEEFRDISSQLTIFLGQTTYDGEFDGVPTDELKHERDELKKQMGELATSDILFCEEDEILKELETKLHGLTLLDEEVNQYARSVSVVEQLETDILSNQKASFLEIFDQVSNAFTRFFNALGPAGSSAKLVLKEADTPASTDPSPRSNSSRSSTETVDIWADFNDGVEPESGFWHRSRGQRSVLSMSLLLAMLSCDTSTLYCFDEIDSAMDERKRDALAEFFNQLRVTRGAQMFFCTHRPEMLAHADTIYLVTNDAMQSNVSEVNVETACNYVRSNALHNPVNEANNNGDDDEVLSSLSGGLSESRSIHSD